MRASANPQSSGVSPTSGCLLQRKCACGSSATQTEGQCEDCQRKKAMGVQARLVVGATDDPLEVEADRAAAQVLRAPDASQPWLTPARVPRLTRRSAIPSTTAEAPPSVSNVLRAPGDALPASTRAFFEPRFGHDFAKVRVHRDAHAAASARDVSAQAYTVGHDIVFGTGQYQPTSPAGRSLLAHELAHVVQQNGEAAGQAGPPTRLRRRGFFEQLAGLFSGDDFDEPTLQDYLERLRRTQRIEDFTDSDNKARAVVNAWHAGDSPYVLTQDLKALLIQEMLSGFAGNDDERAVLELLERSFNFELAHIFGAGGVTASALNRAFQGGEQACLTDFFNRRFQGGEAALERGTVEPQGDAIPFGDQVPTQCAFQVQLPGFGVDWSLPCLLGILCSDDEQVVDDLRRFDVQTVSSIEVDFWEYSGSSWQIRDTRQPGGAANAEATPPEVKILSNRSCDQAAATVVHEVRHQTQPAGSRFERERDAYRFTEQWTLDRGLPGYGNGFRAHDPNTGRQGVDHAAVDTYVRQRYPGTSGAASETIVDHRAGDDFTEVRDASGQHVHRPPQAGDSHWGDPRFLGARPVSAGSWVCPGPRPVVPPSLPPEAIRRDFNTEIGESVRDL